jgi:hypothetical protein
MSGQAEILLTIAGIHFLGLACCALLMIPALRGGPDIPPPQSDPSSEGGGGHGPRRPPLHPETPRGGIPLSDAEPARVRLREHGRLADQLPRRQRRPAHQPERSPVRVGR